MRPSHRPSRVRRATVRILLAGLIVACGKTPSPDAAATPPVVPTATASQRLREFADCSSPSECPVMIELPGAEYMMGSPATETGRYDDEDQRRVAVRRFAVGKYPVTRGQWAAFTDATKRPVARANCAFAQTLRPTWQNPGFPQTTDHPVVCISWPDAHDYAAWLSQRTGHRYRLLTDEEWEYAARAGSVTPYPWGTAASHDRANYGRDTCCGPAVAGRDTFMFTSPVGAFPANAFGLYDMHGNVSEWLESCADTLEKLPIPKGATGCTYRYGRGGVYADPPNQFRSAAKNMAPPPNDPATIDTYRSAGFGLRIARDLDAAPPARR